MSDFIQSKEISLYEIKAKTKSFFISKELLFKYSKILKTMNEIEMKEKNSNCWDLSKYDDEIIDSFVRYLYGAEFQTKYLEPFFTALNLLFIKN